MTLGSCHRPLLPWPSSCSTQQSHFHRRRRRLHRLQPWVRTAAMRSRREAAYPGTFVCRVLVVHLFPDFSTKNHICVGICMCSCECLVKT